MMRRVFAAVVCVFWFALSAVAAGDEPTPAPDADGEIRKLYDGVLSFYLENDLFLNSDDNYTSGVGASWTSDDVRDHGPKNFMNRLVRTVSFLPPVKSRKFRNFVSFVVGQEMYTPTDIESPVPPPDQQPYAGVIFLDTTVYAHGRRSMHGFTLRLGCVGPCSGAEQVQRTLHEWIGSPIPQGWDYQLSNEFLLNVNYTWDRRLLRRVEPRKVHYDLSLRLGGGIGNYYTGGNAGIVARVGHRLPDNYAAANFRTGGASGFVGLAPAPGRGWQGYLFAGFQSFGVARFLPTDGNTFGDGPSVDRSNLIHNLSTGLVIGAGRVLFSWTLNNVASVTEFRESRTNDFGTLTFSYYFLQRKKAER